MDKKIQIEDLETAEHNMFLDVCYNGEPFSGIAYEDTPYYHSEYSYLNGFGHGRSFSIYSNGNLYEEFFMDMGVKTEEKEWYQSGSLKSNSKHKPYLYQFWDENGVMIMENTDPINTEWYLDGSLKSEHVKKKEFTYYGKDGEWAVKIPSDGEYLTLNTDIITYNDKYVYSNYFELLQEDDFYMYFIRWLDKSLERIPEILCKLIQDGSLGLKYNAINLANKYCIKEAIPYIKKEINNHEKPPTLKDKRGFSSHGYTNTIAQRAEIALKSLEDYKK